MKFKPGDFVQINPQYKPYLSPQDWDKYANRPLLVKSISEREDWVIVDDQATGSLLDGISDLFISWTTNQSLNIEELI